MAEKLTKAWSYSALTAYENCPRRYYLTRVSREVVEPQSEAIVWGNQVHSALEERAKTGKALPEALAKYDRYVEKIICRPGKRLVEQQLTINSNFKPTTWMAKDAWCRSVVDIGIVGDTSAIVMDWKTGKRKPDSDQLKLFAAQMFIHYPWIDRVTTGFIWLKEDKLDKDEFTRDQAPEIWDEFLQRTSRLAVSYKDGKWLPRPSGLCRNWCPVGKSKCEFCGGD